MGLAFNNSRYGVQHLKKALVINFFPAFAPPASGGELRYYNMYSHLSAYYDVTLLSPTHGSHPMEIITHSDTFREHRIPKDKIFGKLHWHLVSQQVSSEVSALACALSSEHLNTYHEKYLELHDNCDIIIHEFPYMLRYDLFFGVDDKPRIYNSHNYESDLLSQIWSGPHADKYLKLIHDLEGELVRQCELVFATCEDDRNRFISDFGVDNAKVKLAPNGINPDEYHMRDGAQAQEGNSVLFIGSGHPPNVEAAEFIIDHLANNCKDIKFKIAGSCCKHLNAAKTPTPNIELLGVVSQEEKEALFRTSTCAINPMFSGSGTNLKTLEFLSAGLPLLSTEVGVRGLGVVDGEHYCMANKDNFAEKLNEFMESPLANRKKIANVGRQHINKTFSWKGIAQHVHQEIEKLEAKSHIPALLVLNDFSVANPAAGGEIRINRLYGNMAHRRRIVLICLNDERKLSRRNVAPCFLEISIPKTKAHLKEQNKISDRFWASTADIITSYMCGENRFLTATVSAAIKFSDIIILSHPYMAHLVSKDVGIPVVYESLNYETSLKEEILLGHPNFKFLYQKVQEAERHAIDCSCLIISCSSDELYPDSGKPVFVVENGVEIPVDNKHVDLEPIKRQMNGHPAALFIGSSHTPNIEAADFIVDCLAEKLPHVYFMIIGSVCDALESATLPDNILLMGKVNAVEKNSLMRIADIAINPMSRGAGSNLKLADYFSAKLPTVTTPVGMRGYEIKHGEHSLVCELEGFSAAIVQLCVNPALSKTIADNAFRFVCSTLDWRILAHKYSDILDSIGINAPLKGD